MNDEPDWRGMARALENDDPAREAGALGMEFGDYILEEEIARGGMGIVYRAWQIPLDRQVALKVMREGLFADGLEVARFRQEASAAAALRHPGLVPVYESGECEGRVFYAMEWIDGPNLAEVTRENPVSAKQAARWVGEVAEVMQHAHEHGIVHRDMKPANVMLDKAGHPRVTDFGMARREGADSSLTLSGQVLGTPGYMAPEMGAGSARTAGASVDIYGLGALLFHLLTGRAPFIGENHAAILRQLLENDPVAPRLLNPSVPRDLETICLKALSREPARRYDSARHMADDLGRFLEGHPVLARPVSAAGKIWRWARRRPALAAALAACAVTLAGGVGGILWQLRQTELARGVAVQRAAEKEEQRQRAENALQEAERSAESRRVSLYAADMPQVQRTLAGSDFYQARLLLDAHRPAAGQTDLRGWEWRRLWQELRGDEMASRDSGRQGVTGVVYSPDGAHLAVCSSKATVWNAATLTLEAESPKKALTSVAFSPDGRTLYLGETGPNLMRLMRWRWQEKDAPAELCSVPGGFIRVAVSPAGDMLAVGNTTRQGGGPDGSVSLHDAATGKVIRTLPESGGFATFSPDGALLATGSWGKTVKLWDPATGEVRRILTDLPLVTALRFSTDGRLLVVSLQKGECRIVDVATGTSRSGTPGYTGEVWEAALSPDGSKLATASLDQSVRLWDAATGQQTAKYFGHERGVGQVAWAADGKSLATGGADGTVKFWSVVKPPRLVERLPGQVARSLFSPGGRHLVMKGPNGNASLHAWPGLEQLGEARVGEPLGFLRGTDTLISVAPSGADGTPRVARYWSVPGLQPGKSIPLPGSEKATHFLRLSDDGRWLSGITATGSVCVWDLAEEGRLTDMDKRIDHRVVRALVLPEPPLLVAACDVYPYLRLFTMPEGSSRGVLEFTGGAAVSLLSAEEGKTLYVVTSNAVVRKWDVAARNELWQFVDYVGALDISPDGQTLICAPSSKFVRLWHLPTRREVARFPTERRVSQVAFSPDGSALLLTEPGAGQPDSTLVLRAPGFDKTDDPAANSLTK